MKSLAVSVVAAFFCIAGPVIMFATESLQPGATIACFGIGLALAVVGRNMWNRIK